MLTWACPCLCVCVCVWVWPMPYMCVCIVCMCMCVCVCVCVCVCTPNPCILGLCEGVYCVFWGDLYSVVGIAGLLSYRVCVIYISFWIIWQSFPNNPRIKGFCRQVYTECVAAAALSRYTFRTMRGARPNSSHRNNKALTLVLK